MSNNQNNGVKAYIPYLIVLGIFLVISAIFSMPYLQGMRLLPHDIEQWLYMSTEIRAYHEQTGANAHWTNNMFSGMPAAMIEFYSSGNWFQKIKTIMFGVGTEGNINPILLFFWAMANMFLLSRSLKINIWLGVIGSIAFAYSSYNPIILTAGHLTKMIDIALMPGVLAGIIYTLRGKYALGMLITPIFLALYIDAGHYQIIYYSIFLILAIVLGYGIYLIQQGKAKQFLIACGILAVIAAVGAGTASTRLMITEEYNKYSMRAGNSELGTEDGKKSGGLDKDYAFKWSNGIGETFTTMVPNLYGGASSMDVGEESSFGEELSKLNAVQYAAKAPLYWGPQQQDGISGSVYFGAIIMALAILSLIFIRSAKKWWLFGAAIFLIMLSWGKNFDVLNYPLFDSLPLLNKFRSPNMALAIPSLIFPLMAIWGLHDLFYSNYTKDELLRKLKLGGGIVLAVMLLILMAVMFVFDYKGAADKQIAQGFGEAADRLMSALREDRKSFAMKDTFRSFAFILAALAALWLFAKDKLDSKVAIIIIGVLCTIDVMGVANRYLNSDKYIDATDYEDHFAARPVDLQIQKDTDPHYRVLDLSRDLFNTANSSSQHHTIGGYHPAKLQIYQDLIASHIGTLNSAVLNMLNTKYIIPQPQQGGALQAIPNPAALGNAWFVSNIKTVNTAKEEMDALAAPSLSNPMDTTKGNFSARNTAILRNEVASKLSNKQPLTTTATATIVLKEYSPNKMVYESNNDQAGYAVFSEIYYPLWRATIDGKEVPIHRTNYVLRGIEVPAGKHTIEMRFVADTFEKGESYSMISSIVSFLLMGVALFLIFRKKKVVT